MMATLSRLIALLLVMLLLRQNGRLQFDKRHS
jgi:hypothetical protein